MTQKQIPKAELKRIHRQFMKEVVGTYDSKNTGNYFDYDSEANYKQGITPKRLGRKLGEKATRLVYDGFTLSLPILLSTRDEAKQLHQRGKHIFLDGFLQDFDGDISQVIHAIEKAQPARAIKAYDSKELFLGLTGISGAGRFSVIPIVPTNYQWDLGEMVFHQVRINPATGIREFNEDYTYRVLEEIAKNLHSSFLDGREPEFGEALVRELLGRKAEFKYFSNRLPAQDALDAIDRYNVTNENLIRVAEQALIFDAQSYADLTSLRRQKEGKKQSYKEQMAKNLENVGIRDLHD